MSSSTLLKTIAHFPRVRATLLGDLVADHYIYGKSERISREAPVLVLRHEGSEVKLGGGANVAANIRALGGRVVAVGALGKDEMGRQLSRLATETGIELQAVHSALLETETKTRILAGAEGTTLQQMLRIDRGHPGPWPQPLRRRLASKLEAALKGCHVAVVSDYGAGALCAETCEVLARHTARGGKLCVDSRHALLSLRGATVCKPNEPELQALTQMPTQTPQQLRAAAHKAFELLSCEWLLTTRGKAGMAIFHRQGKELFLPVHGLEAAVDATGAGDTVLAGFALAFAASNCAFVAARLANIAGALVVQKQGTATIGKREFLEEVARTLRGKAADTRRSH
ncbi:MAG: PfkB family carbohydrate kinase [Proteobacteria bacterium]|nr:PfkB family carbohydrate kinase [Cystobacterineae bacterium]MCL2314543.1 PfkB family carbohydrate kinase [Pseudomonadota bacterium]